MKPEAVARTEHVLGAAAERWTSVASRGYALGDRWIIQLEGGRTVFAKKAIDEPTAGWLRAEHHVYGALEPPFAPRLLGWDDGILPLLLLEDLSGAVWPPPWSGGSIDAVLTTLREVAATRPPAELPRVADDPPLSWDEVERDPEPFLQLGLCTDAWLESALSILSGASAPDVLDGDALLHFDIRSDNLCIRNRRALLIDWNLARVGNADLDVALWLPSLALEGGPEPDTIAHTSSGVKRLAAFVAGFFAARAGLPSPTGAPAVRAFQLAQLKVALPWAIRATGLTEPR